MAKTQVSKMILKTRLDWKNHRLKLLNLTRKILKNKDEFFKEVFNLSLFEQKNFFIDNVNDKILSYFQELEEKNNEHEIYLFAEILDKKSKLEVILKNRKNVE